MNELRIDIGGNNRGFQRATEEAVGIAKSATAKMDEMHKKEASDYTSWWAAALEKRESAEKVLTEKRLAEIEQLKEAQLQANLEIMAGSGGQSWRASAIARAGGEGGGRGMAGMVAGQAAMDAMNGGFKEAGKNAAMLAGSLHLAHAAERVMEGKNPFAGIARLPHAVMETVEGLVKFAPLLARITGITAILAESWMIASAALKAGSAANAANESQKGLAAQSGQIKGRLTEYIDDQIRSGQLSQSEAARLKGMLTTHEGIVRAQRELMLMQDKDLKAKAEKDSGIAAADARKATADEKIDKIEEKDHTEAEYAKDLAAQLRTVEQVKKNMAAMDKDSVAYHQAAAYLSETQLKILQDQEKLKTFHDKPTNTVQPEATHIDSMSSAGLMQSISAATSNPMLEVAKQQLHHLATIAHNTTKTGTQDPHAP